MILTSVYEQGDQISTARTNINESIVSRRIRRSMVPILVLDRKRLTEPTRFPRQLPQIGCARSDLARKVNSDTFSPASSMLTKLQST